MKYSCNIKINPAKTHDRDESIPSLICINKADINDHVTSHNLEDYPMGQHDLTPRTYVLHKITIVLKIMSHINQKLRLSYQTVLNLYPT